MSMAESLVRPTVSRRIAGAALLLVALALGAGSTGCSEQKADAAPPPARSTTGDGSLPAVLATVGDEQITLADVRARAADELDPIENRFRISQHKILESALDDILRERVLGAEAKRQGKTLDQMLEAELGAPIEPSEVEIAAWYSANRSRTGGRPLEQIRPQIADFLREARRDSAATGLEERLYRERNVKINLEPYRVALNNDGAPTFGPEKAAVTLVEFSDFQCPFCGRFVSTLQQVKQNYGDRVRVVYRQYPIPSLHPNAFKAAEASLCANDQGKFWEMHDQMFQQQDRLTVRDLKAMAGRLGLDQREFDGCVDSGRYTEQVQEDIKEGNRVGVSGTPAIFVNGVMLPGGAVPYETVAKALESELARVQR